MVSAAARWAVGGRHQCLSILIFHRVLAQPDPFMPDEPDAQRFADIMEWLSSWFKPLSLSEGIERLRAGTLPPRALCVTFDDGYADNLLVAAPICRRFGVPVTVFVASGYLDGRVMWNDRIIESVRGAPGDHLDLTELGYGRYKLGDSTQRVALIGELLRRWKYLPFEEREELTLEMAARYAPAINNPMLSRAQVRQLHGGGVEIGGHTVTHPILARTDTATAAREIADNKDDLEGLLGGRLRFFAYPNGLPHTDFTLDHVEMVRRVGYQAAFSTHAGVSTSGTDRFQMPRFTPWDKTSLRFSLRLILNMRNSV